MAGRFDYLEVGDEDGATPRRPAAENELDSPVIGVGYRPAAVIGSFGHSLGEFNSPTGLQTDAAGNLYVADSLNQRVVRIGPDGSTDMLGEPGSGPGQFRRPRDLAVDARHSMYVLDAVTCRIQRFAADGTFVGAIGGKGQGPGRLQRPEEMAFTLFNDLLVVDSRLRSVICLDWRGQQKATYRPTGAEWMRPTGIAVDTEGWMYVSDSERHVIDVLAPDGSLQATWGGMGSMPGQLNQPAGLEFADGALFVADAGNHRVQVFSNLGDVLDVLTCEPPATAPLKSPQGVAVGADSRLFVADTMNHRIVEFSAG